MSKKLHILFLSSWYPSRVLATNGDFVKRHAEAVATKHQVTLVHVVTDANLSVIEMEDSIINNIRTILVYIPKKSKVLKLYYFFKAYISAVKKIDSFDIVHLNVIFPKGLIALYLKKVWRKPYIITEHWTGYQSPRNKSIGYLEKLITKRIVKNAFFVCPVSCDLKNSMLEFGLKGNYQTVPNVVDTELFKPIEKSKNPFVITHVSSFNEEQKNITGILNAIKKLSEKEYDFIFKIAGNGNFNNIKKTIEQLKIPETNIELIETKSQVEIAEILQKTNLYISFSNYETFGIVMVEALATGTPVLSTNTGILTEFNASEFSTITPIKDEKTLLKNIIKHLESTETYPILKMHNLIDQNFSKTSVCFNFTSLYLKVLKSIN